MSALLVALLAASPYLGAVSGAAFDDGNGNGRRDPGEAGLAAVVVSDGSGVTQTGADGSYRLEAGAGRYVFVVLPGDRRAVGAWYQPRAASLDFALAPNPAPAEWRFAHLSDTHVDAGNAERMRTALGLARDRHADFALVSGDLVKDALRVGEATARHVFGVYLAELAKAGLPVRSVLGNHDVFGIERHESLVPKTHPAYGKALYEETLGPRYYAFNRGRLHFIVLDTIGVDDVWYYGFVDPGQLEWIRQELALLPPETAVVTVGHIPLRVGSLSAEFRVDGPARTLQTVNGETSYRHVVRNTAALQAALKPHPWPLALQGHMHLAERLRIWDGGSTRFETAPAVDRQAWAPGPTGIVVYTVRGDAIGEGEIVPIDSATAGSP